MSASTPSITPEELAKRMEDPMTYCCGSAALLGKYREQANCICQVCRSPIGSATSSCDDSPKWRQTLAAREEIEEEELEKEYETAGSTSTAKELFRSPAKTVFTHNVESGNTPDGAAGWQWTTSRAANEHPGVPGWRESSPVHPATPSWQKE